MTDENWRAQAYCRTPVAVTRYGPEIWYPDSRAESWLGTSLCQRRCPVREACLAYALAHRERYGTWGGLSQWDRRERRGIAI